MPKLTIWPLIPNSFRHISTFLLKAAVDDAVDRAIRKLGITFLKKPNRDILYFLDIKIPYKSIPTIPMPIQMRICFPISPIFLIIPDKNKFSIEIPTNKGINLLIPTMINWMTTWSSFRTFFNEGTDFSKISTVTPNIHAINIICSAFPVWKGDTISGGIVSRIIW